MKTTLFPYVENYQIFHLTPLYPNMARLYILLMHLFIIKDLTMNQITFTSYK